VKTTEIIYSVCVCVNSTDSVIAVCVEWGFKWLLR